MFSKHKKAAAPPLRPPVTVANPRGRLGLLGLVSAAGWLEAATDSSGLPLPGRALPASTELPAAEGAA